MTSTEIFKDSKNETSKLYNVTQNDTLGMSKTQSSYSRTGNLKTIYGMKKNPKDLDKDRLLLLTEKDEKVVPFLAQSSYEGQWQNNMKHGIGIENLENNLVYEGEYQNDKRHGNGILYKIESTKSKHNPRKSGNDIKRKLYDGDWVNGLKDGKGIYYYKNGDLYNGNWKSDKRHKYGVLYVSETEDIYDCEWINGLQEGHGTMFIKNGNIYSGNFANGLKQGNGKFLYASTNKLYEGEWIDDKPNCGEFRDPTIDEMQLFDKLREQYQLLINLKSSNEIKLDQSTLMHKANTNNSITENNMIGVSYKISLPELGLVDPNQVLNESKNDKFSQRK